MNRKPREMPPCSCFYIILLLVPYIAFFGPVMFAEAALDNAGSLFEVTADISGELISPYVSYYRDTDGSLDIETIASDRSLLFTPSGMERLNLGYSRDVIWLRLKTVNHSGETIRWYLEHAYPQIDYITLYIPDNSGYQAFATGDYLPFDTRPFPYHNFVFPLEQKPGESIYYIRMESEGTLLAPLYAWSVEAFEAERRVQHPLLWMYYGLIIALSLYNALIYFSVREPAYIYLPLFLLSLAAFTMVNIGLAFQYLWPNSPWWANKCYPFLIFVIAIFGILFTRSFLNIPLLLPRWARIYMIVLLGAIVMAILSFVLPYYYVIQIAAAYVIIVCLICCAAGLILLQKKNRQARFYVIAWSLFLVAASLIALRMYGVVPDNYLTEWSYQITSAITAVLLSLGVADKINVFREERELAFQEIDNLNKSLENKVAERTRELSLAYEKLQELDTRKTETLYMVTHDLRTPMTSIVGFSRLISQKYQRVLLPLLQNSSDKKVNRATEQIMTNIRIIEEEGQRLTGLINNFLDLSKLEEGKVTLNREKVKIEDCVKQSLDAVSALTREKNLKTVVEIVPEVADIRADREKLIQVMINLLSNAIKFTPEGSVTCRAEQDDKRVIISIIDTGRGMTPAEQDGAFEKFKQVGKQDGTKQKGTGLGLPICKQIVEMHGGEIWVESEPGLGSTFSFSLPVS